MMVPLKYRSKMDMLIRKGFPLIEVRGKGSEVVISAIFKKQINAFVACTLWGYGILMEGYS